MKPPSSSLRRARPLLGTIVDIRIAGNAEAAMHGVDAAFAAIERVHRLMSAHDPTSDVSRINRARQGATVSVDAWTQRVLRRAKELSLATDGLFDCCVGPLLQASGYLPRWDEPAPRHAPGRYHDIELLDKCALRLNRPLQITLDGIAKGFAVDVAVGVLQHAGIAAGVVNAGGDLRVFGTQVEEIHVRDPARPDRLMPVARLQNGALATSATYFSRTTHAGRPVSHIFNPRTGETCLTKTSVSILAQDCMTADALAKAVLLDSVRITPRLALLGAEAVVLGGGRTDCVNRLRTAREAPCAAGA